MTAFKIGDKVVVNPEYDRTNRFSGKVFVVKKAPTRQNEVNYTLGSHNHEGRGLKCRGDYLLPFTGQIVGLNAPRVDTVRVPKLQPGALVRFKSVLNVVTHVYPDGTYRLFPLGGGNRYWKHVRESQLEVIDPSRVRIDG